MRLFCYTLRTFYHRKEEDASAIVSKHIKLLHRYNEAKDATQILIGKVWFVISPPSFVAVTVFR